MSSKNKLNKFDNVQSLSRLWAGRYHSIYPRYKANSLALLSHLSIRGRNSFEEMISKSDTVNNSTGNNLNYNRSVTAAFPLNVKISEHTLNSTICDARSKFGLERLKGYVNPQCVSELYKLFIVNKVMEKGPDGKNHPVYIPVFALLAE